MQVAGKIAADITPKSDDVQLNIANWVMAFDATVDALFDKMGMSQTASPVATEQFIESAFPNSQPVNTQPAFQPAQGGQVRIKGTQHGPIPAWLYTECAKKGVTEVWDNRDGLAVNPKRPWFKSTTGQDAFWEPRVRR